MSEQAPLDATFFAFRKRDRGLVLTSAAIAYHVLLLGIFAAFIALTWGVWGEMINWYVSVIGSVSNGGAPSSPPQGAVLTLAPYWLASIPISLLAFAAFEAACLRWLVRGEAGGGLFGLKLDADTWRVFAVYWCWVLYFVCVAVAVGALYALFAGLGGFGGVAGIFAMLLGALTPIAVIAFMVWAGVLFAPAAAASVGRKKLTFLSARKVSAPRYWPLLTSYFMVIIGYFIAATVASAILQIPINNAMRPVLAAILGGGSVDVVASLREALLTPVMITVLAANVVLSFVLAAVYYVAMFGVNARAFEAAAEAGDVGRT